MITELQTIEDDLQRLGTYRVKDVQVADATEYFTNQRIDKLTPTLVKGEVALEYIITVIVKPHAK